MPLTVTLTGESYGSTPELVECEKIRYPPKATSRVPRKTNNVSNEHMRGL